MESELARRARRHYERSRLKKALWWGLPALVLAIGLALRGFTTSVPFALLAAPLAVGMAWRGQGWAQGVGPGLVAGLVTGLVPLYLACGEGCSANCQMNCSSFALAAGIVGGLTLTRTQGAQATLGGLSLASLLAMSGCVALGVGGWMGVAAVSAISVPVAALRPAQS